METKNLMTIPLTSEKKENCWFVALLMSLYSTHSKNLILNKSSTDSGSLLSIIKKILNEYYYYNTTTLNFFHIITPEILLLKSLSLMNLDNLRDFIINTKNFKLPMSFICDFHHNISINCFKIITIDNINFYCEINNIYDLNVVDDKLIYQNNMMMNIDAIKNRFSSLLNGKPEMILIQKDNNDTEEAVLLKTIIGSGVDYEKTFNLNNYGDPITDTYKNLDDIIFINKLKYRLDSCIIKSNKDDSYLVLLHFNDKKFIYDIKNELLSENDWNLKTFVYNDYNFSNSPSIFMIYTIIDNFNYFQIQ